MPGIDPEPLIFFSKACMYMKVSSLVLDYQAIA
jgi:hypothetical protein